MTTDRELRDLLTAEANAPARPAGWDEIVRRGHHHRRLNRARTGVVLGGVAAMAIVGLIAVTDLGEDEHQGVVANQPDGMSLPTASDTTGTLLVPDAVDLTAARAGAESEMTLIIEPSDPTTGYDPCVETGPLLDDGLEIRISVVPVQRANAQWTRCWAGPFSGVGTVALGKPVHDRRVIDRSDGQPITVVDEAGLLVPAELPAAFEPDARDEFSQGTYEGVRIDAWTFSWTSQDLVLNVSRWPVDGERPEGCGGGEAVEAPGVTGELCIAQSSALLSWIDGNSFRIVELVDVSGGPLPGDIDLVAIANGLRPLG